jgi:hypothetical protein
MASAKAPRRTNRAALAERAARLSRIASPREHRSAPPAESTRGIERGIAPPAQHMQRGSLVEGRWALAPAAPDAG